jgi:predicted transcriptional regulator
LLDPLTKTELVAIFNKRLQLLTSKDVKNIIKPFEDSVIASFYEIFQGDIRMVMNALRDTLTRFSDSFPKTLTIDESIVLLGSERMSRIEKQLTEDKLNVLTVIINNNRPITQVAIAKALNKQQTNISSYFKKLAELGIIEVKHEEGKLKYWYLTAEYLPLQRMVNAQKSLREKFGQVDRQLEMFSK